VVLDGAPCGTAVPCEIKRYPPHNPAQAWRPVLYCSQQLPLPLGARITRLLKTGAAEVEMHAVSPIAVASAAEDRVQVEREDAAAVEVEVLPSQAMPPQQQTVPHQSHAQQRHLLPQLPRPPPPPAREQQQQQPVTASGSSSRAGAANGNGDSDSVTPAALLALGLNELQLPPPGSPEEAAALLEAPFLAYTEVERAAMALGLALAEVDAVCQAVMQKTEGPAAAKRFLRMEYRGLWRACSVGEVALARAWMARMAAAGAAGRGV
jgi:hypothetical protein